MQLFKFLALAILATTLATANAQERVGDALDCPNVLDFTDYKGQTYLNFMQDTVKPLLDTYATEGYEVTTQERIMSALDVVSSKVRRGALRASEGQRQLRRVAEELEGESVTLNTLPGLIRRIDRDFDQYKLSTYIGLASCAGAVIKYYDDNYAYNVHYDTREKRSGRSFSSGPTRGADDASYKAYLRDTEEYITEDNENIEEFFRTLMQALTNSDNGNYSEVTPLGQTLATDFLTVYTAEQARNLMDGRVNIHWDAALLEVTMLAAFHAGQEEIRLLYFDPIEKRRVYTDTTYKQTTGCSENRGRRQDATLVDYWQFSTSPDPKHCSRSGVNIDKGFRELGERITVHLARHHREELDAVKAHFDIDFSRNIFFDLSKFLINHRTDSELGEKAYELSEDFTKLMMKVKESAPEIDRQLRREYPSL